jgi:organic radical activating enzyme
MRQKITSSSDVRLSEIFTSIEGEGILLGTKTLFVRFAGCPLKCHWCDTQYAIPFTNGLSLTVDKVKELIAARLDRNTFKINFTGGEPLAQAAAVVELGRFAQGLGLATYLESACHDSDRFKQVLPVIDFCKIEFKLSDSMAVDLQHHRHLIINELECLRAASEAGKIVYIKIVITASSNLEDFRGLVKEIFNVVLAAKLAGFIIQPSSTADGPSLERLLEFYDVVYPFYNDVRIIPQLHKALGAR